MSEDYEIYKKAIKQYKLKLLRMRDNGTLSIILSYLHNNDNIIKMEKRIGCIIIRLDVPDTTKTGRLRFPYKDFIIYGKTEEDIIILENMFNKLIDKKDRYYDCYIDYDDITFIFVDDKLVEEIKRNIKKL